MAAARKQKRFQWNLGNKIENRIHCLSNFKALTEALFFALFQNGFLL